MSAEGVARGGARVFLPILDWLPRYESAWLRGDVVAGVTAWALVVPHSVAYALLGDPRPRDPTTDERADE